MAEVLKQTYSMTVRTGITCVTKIYQVSQNTETARTTGRAVATLNCTNGQSFHLDNDGVVTIKAAGVTIINATGRPGFDFRDYTSKEIYNGTFTVDHESDGTYSKIFSTTCTYGTYATGTGSGNVSFDTIPRGSKLGNIEPFNLEDTINVPVTKYSESFADTLVIKIGDTEIKTIVGYTNNADINLTDDELIAAYRALSDESGTVTFELTTKSGATTVGTDSKTAEGTAAGSVYLTVGDEDKRAIWYENVSGIWKKCVGNINVSDVWKRGKP